MSKFRKGDRVVYHCDGTGNPDLHGRHGKIIGVDRSHSPYTVQFDEEFWGAMEDMRFGGKKGHCWCCTESHLEKEDGGADDDPSDDRQNLKENETMAVVCISKWTKEQDEKLLAMKAEGKSSSEMAIEINKTVEPCDQKTAEQCYQRLYYLKKVKGKYGVTNATETAPSAAEKAEVTTPSEGLTHSEEQKGELNDLEKVLAATITEQEAEIDRLRGDVKDLEGGLCQAHEENTRLYDQIGPLTEKVASLESELQNTATALAQTETELDKEREAMRNVCAELEQAKAAEDDFKSMVESYAAEAAEYKKRLAAVDMKYEELSREFSQDTQEKNERIAELEALIERYRNLIIVQAERLMRHEC